MNNIPIPPPSSSVSHNINTIRTKTRKITNTVSSVKSFLAHSAQKAKPEPKRITLQDGVHDALEKLPQILPSNLSIPSAFYQFCESDIMLCFLDAILKYFRFCFEELEEKVAEAKAREHLAMGNRSRNTSSMGMAGRLSSASGRWAAPVGGHRKLSHFSVASAGPRNASMPSAPHKHSILEEKGGSAFRTAPPTAAAGALRNGAHGSGGQHHGPMLVGYRSPFRTTHLNSVTAPKTMLGMPGAPTSVPNASLSEPVNEDGFSETPAAQSPVLTPRQPQHCRPKAHSYGSQGTALRGSSALAGGMFASPRLQGAGTFSQLDSPWTGIPEDRPSSGRHNSQISKETGSSANVHSHRSGSQASSGALHRRQRRSQRRALLAAAAQNYSTLVLHCSNYENSLGDQRFFEVLLCFISVVTKEVFGDMSAHFNEMDAEIDRLFRGGTMYFNPFRYKPYDVDKSQQNNQEDDAANSQNNNNFQVPTKQGENSLPAVEDWENRSNKVTELAEANILISEQLRKDIGLASWRALQRKKNKKHPGSNLPKGYINSKVYNKSPILTSIIPDKAS